MVAPKRRDPYKSYVKSALSYGAECWALKVEDERKLKTAETSMLRMISGKTLKDKINKKKIQRDWKSF